MLVLRLFGTAGIRKKYPDELNPILAYKLGLAVSTIKEWDKAYIVYDTRTTNHLFTYSFASGLMAGGVNCYFIGLAPTPIAGYAAKKYRGLGVSVTASHNPPEYNGYKFYDNEGYEFTRTLEKEIEKKINEQLNPVDWSRVGISYWSEGMIDEYISDLVNYVNRPDKKWEPIIVIDLANGAAYKVSPEVMRKLGAKPLTINADPNGYFPIRAPEPRKDVLEKYLDLYTSVNPPVILAHDGDADRLAVLDPVKGFIRQDRIIAFYAYLLLSQRRGRVIVSIDTGRVIDEIVEKMGGKIERYVLGKTHERLKQVGASNIVLAAEPWKLIDPSWGPWVDGVLQVALITKTVIEHGKPFSKILDEIGIPDYPWDRRSYKISPVEKRDKIYDEFVEELKHLLGEPVNVITIDGYRFEYSDYSWILVRKSGTEPKIRLYMEAPTNERLREMIELSEKKLVEIVKRNNAIIIEKTIG